ncbi:hypothetical protein Q75_14610 [Bacillus coahuilensis p1.1.43]|uniref:Tail specific protease domain-containing protein n=1 Tax=Bacillus coahuilensis p1.1.43 TaxID=1150625 RepID=A0A147K526_9BACI|nr:S41 family peptidase [Bacillus coahuilensis]KUP04687.1 hypothetical protein Q75_14610 [Bacillus coahuilensis p1.1.43]
MQKIIIIICMSIIIVLALSTALVLYINTGRPPSIDETERQVWKSIGYHIILEMDNEDVIVYNYTKDSLLPFGFGTINDTGEIVIEKLYGAPLLNLLFWTDTASGTFHDGVVIDLIGFKKYFERIEDLPDVKIKTFTKNPVHNYEVFFNLFEENYSLFKIANVDWNALYSEYRAKVTEQTTDEELLATFKEMIQLLNDGHTNVLTGLQSGVGSKREKLPGFELYLDNQEKIKKNSKNYLSQKTKCIINKHIEYAPINDDLYYVRVNDFYATDKQAIKDGLTKLQRDLDGISSIIVDLRLNHGGTDYFALQFAELFAKEEVFVFSKQTRVGDYDEFNEPTNIYMSPADHALKAEKVIVMTSNVTGSAAEVATMAFDQMNHVTIIGETTMGVHSDIIMSILPNGWIVTLSAEKYTAADGNVYEQIGLFPDEKVILTEEAVLKGLDTVLERAIQFVK